MKKTSRIARSAIIAAAYAVLTIALPMFSYGPIQFRISEALCVLPFFMGEAVAGLTVGCFMANLIGVLMGATMPWDVLVGTAATFAAAFITGKIRIKWLVPLPAVVFNAVFVGAMLTYVILPGTETTPMWFNMLTVGIGEAIAAYGLGMPVLAIFDKVLKRKQEGFEGKKDEG